MRLFNTLGRRLEDFKPLKKGRVKLYTCGPTVYDYAHIGNLRSFVFDDILRRALQVNGYKVSHVMNITDVGHLVGDMDEGADKLEAGAKREGKSVWDIAAHYIKAFKDDIAELNILPPNAYRSGGGFARATDFIDQQLKIVQILLAKGYAYQTEQAIYFDVTKLPSYGELSGQKLDEKEVGAREQVVTDANKRHPQDFALWFFLVGRFAGHTMRWESPWGDGFPGWHLECSAIIHDTLGDPIDIHTGGVDHIGTHHTNEMAQTEAAFGHKLANFWLHNEFVLVDGQKMSKSLNNFLTLKSIEDKGYEPLALRLLFLQAHYRSQLNFTWESLDAAQIRLKRYRAFADLHFQLKPGAGMQEGDYFKKAVQNLSHDLANDLASGVFLAHLDEIIDRVDQAGPGIHPKQAKPFGKLLDFIEQAVGLDLLSTSDITKSQKDLISRREAARRASDWHLADSLRAELDEQGIEINDTATGPVWSRK